MLAQDYISLHDLCDSCGYKRCIIVVLKAGGFIYSVTILIGSWHPCLLFRVFERLSRKMFTEVWFDPGSILLTLDKDILTLLTCKLFLICSQDSDLWFCKKVQETTSELSVSILSGLTTAYKNKDTGSFYQVYPCPTPRESYMAPVHKGMGVSYCLHLSPLLTYWCNLP
jgi:hypothetical protein